MTEVQFELKHGLKELLDETRTGDPELNARTRADARLAEQIAHHIKLTYELGLEYEKKASQWADPYTQWELGKYAVFDCYGTANRRAAKLAAELGD